MAKSNVYILEIACSALRCGAEEPKGTLCQGSGREESCHGATTRAPEGKSGVSPSSTPSSKDVVTREARKESLAARGHQQALTAVRLVSGAATEVLAQAL